MDGSKQYINLKQNEQHPTGVVFWTVAMAQGSIDADD